MKVSEHKPFKAVKTFFESDLKQMAEGKNVSEKSKKHWRHKAYQSDFGGAKDETL